MMTVLIVLLGAMTVGAVLTWLGWRGRRLNDHPTCRQCRFDLSGTPPPLTTCPECGCGLKRPGWVLNGQRRRMPLILGLGALLLVVPAAAIFTAAGAVAAGVDVNRLKPVGWLAWESKSISDKARRDTMATEIIRRASLPQGQGGINKEQWRTLIDATLAMQADLSRPWSEQWGEVYEQARVAGETTDADEKRFLNQAVVLEWKARPRVSVGKPIPLVATVKETRIGLTTMAQSAVYASEHTIDGVAISAAQRSPSVNTYNEFGRQFAIAAQPSATMIGWVPLYGKSSMYGQSFQNRRQELSVQISSKGQTAGQRRVGVVSQFAARRQQAGSYTLNEPQRSENDRKVELAVELAEGPTVTPVTPSEADLAKLQEGFRAVQAQVQQIGRIAPIGSRDEFTLGVSISVPERPASAYAFNVFAKTARGEAPLGRVASGALSRSAMQPMYTTWQDANTIWLSSAWGTNLRQLGDVKSLKSIDVVLRPSATVAEQTIDVTQYADAEITLSGISLQHLDQRGQPINNTSTAEDTGADDKPKTNDPDPAPK